MSRSVARHPGAGETLEAGPTTTTVKVAGADSEGRLSAVEMKIGPGWEGPPPHVHQRVDHLWFVLSGEVRLTIDDRPDIYPSGSCVFVPSGSSHTFGVPGDNEAVLLQVDTPVALDGYFRELSAAFPKGAPVDPTRVGEIMLSHDTYPV